MSTPADQTRVSRGILTMPAKVFDWIVDGLANLANLLMAFIVVLITVEVVLRYFFNTGILWAGEVTEDCMLWMTFLASAWVLRREAHVIVDLIPNRLRPRHKALLFTLLSIIGILVCFIYTWYGTTTTIDLAQRQRHLSTLLRPQAYILYMIIPIGFFLLTIQFCRRTYKYYREFKALGKEAINPN
jgi:TRAP-type transport system small permease protein